MDKDYILNQIKLLRDQLANVGAPGTNMYRSGKLSGIQAQIAEFIRLVAGQDNYFHRQATETNIVTDRGLSDTLDAVLDGFAAYVESGLLDQQGLRRSEELEVVSDLMMQANAMLNDDKMHPAVAAFLIGATLEEYLRTWTERLPKDQQSDRKSLDGYAGALRRANKITSQDIKDITSWAGYRNDAAHGRFDQVNDRDRIRNMLEGVNLFMRKYE